VKISRVIRIKLNQLVEENVWISAICLWKWCHNNKHLAQLAPQRGGKTAGIDMTWRNYVAVTLCIQKGLEKSPHCARQYPVPHFPVLRFRRRRGVYSSQSSQPRVPDCADNKKRRRRTVFKGRVEIDGNLLSEADDGSIEDLTRYHRASRPSVKTHSSSIFTGSRQLMSARRR